MPKESIPQGRDSNYETMDFSQLANDPVAGPVLERQALEYLKTQDRAYFEREFTGKLDAEGYLIEKEDGKARTKPSMNITGGVNKVLEMTRRELTGKESGGDKEDTTPPLEQNKTEAELSAEAQHLTRLIDHAESIQDLIVAFGEPDIEGIRGSDNVYTSNEMSKRLYDVLLTKYYVGVVPSHALDSITRSLDLRNKVEQILAKSDQRPLEPLVATERFEGLPTNIERNVKLARNLGDFLQVIEKFGGITAESGEYYSYRDFNHAVDHALKHKNEGEDRYSYFTRSYGIRDKAKEVIELYDRSPTEFFEESRANVEKKAIEATERFKSYGGDPMLVLHEKAIRDNDNLNFWKSPTIRLASFLVEAVAKQKGGLEFAGDYSFDTESALRAFELNSTVENDKIYKGLLERTTNEKHFLLDLRAREILIDKLLPFVASLPKISAGEEANSVAVPDTGDFSNLDLRPKDIRGLVRTILLATKGVGNKMFNIDMSKVQVGSDLQAQLKDNPHLAFSDLCENLRGDELASFVKELIKNNRIEAFQDVLRNPENQKLVDFMMTVEQ